MPVSSTNKWRWFLLISLLLLFIFISYVLNVDNEEHYPPYASDSPAPNGTKGFYTYMKTENEQVSRWSHSPALLDKSKDKQLLIIVEPLFIPGEHLMNEYISFMEAGNTILLLQNNPEGMLDIEVEPIIEVNIQSEQVMDKTHHEFTGEVSSFYRINEHEDDDVLLYDDAGTIALSRTFGSGELVVANTPHWLMNEFVLEKDHLPLLLEIFFISEPSYELIMFDEYSHHPEHELTMFTLYPKWLLVLGFQLILLVVFWLWYKGKRFGSIVTPREEAVRYSNERIKAIAAWYQKGKLYHDSLTNQANYLRLILQQKHGIPYYEEWNELSEHLYQIQANTSTEEVQSFLKDLTKVLEKKQINKQQYLLWMKKMYRLEKEVEEG